MVLNSKATVSEEQNERHKRILAALLKEPGNKQCCDCGVRNPTWASINLGVFMCLTCSGIHRSLGVHISQVRSVNLDTWLPRQVEFCKAMGNVKGNRYWEAKLPANFRRPPSGTPNPELASFIRDKYVDRRYVATDVSEPPNIDNYMQHPYTREEAGNGQASGNDSSGHGGSEHQQAVGAGRVGMPALAGYGGSNPGLRTMSPSPNPVLNPANSAPSPAPGNGITTDLLGGFDELLAGTSNSASQTSQANAAGSSLAQQPAVAAPAPVDDPFAALAVPAVPAPLAANSSVQGRVSLDWTDFHGPAVAAAPAISHSHSQSMPQALATLQPPAVQQSSGQQPQDPFLALSSGLQTMTLAPAPGSSQQPQVQPQQQPTLQPTTSGKHGAAKSADEILRLFDQQQDRPNSGGDMFGSFHSSGMNGSAGGGGSGGGSLQASGNYAGAMRAAMGIPHAPAPLVFASMAPKQPAADSSISHNLL